MSGSVIFPWHSQRKGESFDASLACEFKEGGYLSSFRTKFAVCPTVPFVSLLCAPRVKLVTGVRAERGEKSRRVVSPSAHSEARLSSIKQYSCHYSPTWIVCSCRLVSVRHTSEACDSAHGHRDWHGWPTITRKARQAALPTRCHWLTQVGEKKNPRESARLLRCTCHTKRAQRKEGWRKKNVFWVKII